MTTHRFEPTRYHNTLGTHEPALRIADGDTLLTSTVDALGYDGQERQVARRGNPQTGPFYVTGAEPGDFLEVHFDSLVPNRRRGFSRSVLAPNVVDPDFVPRLPAPADPDERIDWHVDLQAGTASPDKSFSGLEHLELPLSPMLGCFGVAPPQGQAISTATSWVHGGNMDYRGFTAGVSAFLPVFVPGALLFMGDGHALQGDGEIAGTGVEISMDVQVSVRVHKGRSIGWPRGKNAEQIFTVGNARPLDQALQHATTEMLRWLEHEYRLEPPAANMLLSQAVQYHVGNVFDPAYTMVCLLPVRHLERSS